MKPHRVYQTTPPVVRPLGKQKVYFGMSRAGQEGLFTNGLLVFALNGVEAGPEARRIAERHGFEYVERESETNS